jgi:hypothetical protein
MNCCERELKELIQIYEARIGRTENFLIELDFKGRSGSISYKINDKLVFLLKQIVKDLKEISDKFDHENQHQRSSSRATEK